MAFGLKPSEADHPEKQSTATTRPQQDTQNAQAADHLDDQGQDEDIEKPVLPFSKARCIALVATVTGAAFLNVTCPPPPTPGGSPQKPTMTTRSLLTRRGVDQTLSVQSVVIIMPTIGRELDIPESRLQWLVSSYSLTFGCFLLFWGRIADIYGKRLLFVAGSVWVTVMTAVNPFVPNEVAFQVVRALHGLGAAANVPTAIGILGVTFPPGKAKNYAFSAYAAGAPLGSVFGNIFSGFIAQYSSWKWVFGATAIIAGVISLAGFFLIPKPPAHARPRAAAGVGSVDWVGAALVTSGLVALMFALTEGNVVGWRTPWIPVLVVVALLVLVAFVFWQRRLEAAGSSRPPLVKMSAFNLRFSAVMLTMALFFAGFNNYLVFATYFYQGFQGLSPIQTMLRFIPTGVAGCIIAAVVANLLSRVPTFYLLVCGNLAGAVAPLLFAVPIPTGTSYFAWGLPAMILSVIGADIAWPCLTLYTSRALRPEDQAIGGALINAMGQFGRAIGLAVSTAIQTAVMARDRGLSVENVGAMQVGEDASLAGLRAASWMNTGYGLCALLVVLVALRSKDIIGKVQPAPPVALRQEEIPVPDEKRTPADAKV
ncbi:hypothetical protein S40288_01356 [Stachybotrys chartarum IBT 40288]|nr:hypothetical protein S40288_01356 [Stachybotrys chartarum IBT 40288]